MQDTLTRESLEVIVNPDDPIKSHIVDCPEDKESTASWLTEARIYGLEIKAICGYIWIPQNNPEKHPLCEPCITEANARIF